MNNEEIIAENIALKIAAKLQQEKIDSQQEKIDSQQEKIDSQQEKIDSLEEQLKELKRLMLGAKSERFVSAIASEQIELFSDFVPEFVPPDSTETITYERKKRKKHLGRKPLPQNIPVEKIIIEPDELTEDMIKIGEDVTKTVKYEPASLTLVLTIRPKYKKVSEYEEKIVQAPAPNRPFPKSIAEASLLAYIIVAKFIDHLPFYRQIQRLKRDYSWNLNKSTINDWFVAVCTLLEPLYDTMVRKTLESDIIQADESHIKVQDGKKKGATYMGWQWVYHAPLEKIVIFHYRKGRGVHGPKEFLKNYSGWLQCDGYKVYDKIGKSKNIKLVGCLVHARRYFDKAKDHDKARAEYALTIFKNIYHHESKCCDMDHEDRKKYRLEYIAPFLTQLKTWMDEQNNIVLPKSPIGKAIRYTLKQWPKLTAVLEDGRLQLDNNLIENKIRPLALGRKNYLFAGNHDAAQRIAMIYTFFATCKANDVNPYKWLKHTLEVISDYKVKELEKLIPGKCNLPE